MHVQQSNQVHKHRSISMLIFALLACVAVSLFPVRPGNMSNQAYASELKPTDTVTLTILGGATSSHPSSNAEYIVMVNKQYSGEAILAAAQAQDASKTYHTLTITDLLAAAQAAGDIGSYSLGAGEAATSSVAANDLISLTSKDGVTHQNWIGDGEEAQLTWEFYQSGSHSAAAAGATPLTASGSYQFCWEGKAQAGIPPSWPIFYLEHVPTGPVALASVPSVVVTVVGKTIPASQNAPETYDVWVNRRVLLATVLAQAQKENPDATLESLTVKDLIATMQAEGRLGECVMTESADGTGSGIVSMASVVGTSQAHYTSPDGSLRLYWAFCEDNFPSALSVSQAKLENAHHYQVVWNMETTALAPSDWTSFYTDYPAQEAYISPAAGYADGWNQTASGSWVYKQDGALIANRWAHLGGAWYHFDAEGFMQTGWYKEGSTWYYLTEAGQAALNSSLPVGSAAVGWRNVHGTWYYFRTAHEGAEGSMVASSWLVQGSKWYYVTESGAMATGWLSQGGTWYYLAPDSGVMQTGWQRVGGLWYYLQPGSGAMKTGWLNQGGTWYYLAPGSGVMQTGWYWVGSKCYYSVTSGAMAHDRWIGSYWVGSDGAWVPSAKR